MARRKTTAGIPSGWMTVTGNSRVKKIRVTSSGVDAIVVTGRASNPKPKKRKAAKKPTVKKTRKAANRKRSPNRKSKNGIKAWVKKMAAARKRAARKRR